MLKQDITCLIFFVTAYLNGIIFSLDCDPIILLLTNIHDAESKRTYMAKSRQTYFETLGCKHVHKVNVYTSSNHRNNLTTDEKIINILFECCLVGDIAIATTLANYKKSACC